MIGRNDDRRIRQLIENAAQASASGRVQEADRLVRQAEAEAPKHPLVLNETARRLLMSGDFIGAHSLLTQAVQEDSSHAAIWLNFAVALRGLKRADEEMTAIDKVLALEPRNLRAMLQKASLQELQGRPRAAAMTYRYVLQSVPAGSFPPQSLRPIFQYAMQFVAANDRELENFLEGRLKDLRARYADEPLQRFDRCLQTLLRKQPVYRPQPSFMYFPRLPALEFYERNDFPWLDSIEAATDDIRAELIEVLQEGPGALIPYVDIPAGTPLDQWRELNQSRRWGVYYLWQEGVAIPEHIARFPRTVAALEAWPRCEVAGCSPTAVFSILDAKTRIPAHTGVSNTRLIVQLPLIVPPGCVFRVGAERRE
ncbi:MAG TPA: aspartyl/asparaginyl beta-hydroxylase domain-containing protein, partial [Steroidobacteraceae bacterium]